MGVSKRLRYEVMRRDNHACRYCGSAAPDVRLTIDHVTPSTLGGSDIASNLVTACVDCNAGKSSVAPDSPIVDGVTADALRWAAAMKVAGDIQAERLEIRADYVHEFDVAWQQWKRGPGGPPVTRPSDWANTIGRHHDAGIEINVLVALVDSVLPRPVDDRNMWRYFCGALRNVTQERAQIAANFIAAQERGVCP